MAPETGITSITQGRPFPATPALPPGKVVSYMRILVAAALLVSAGFSQTFQQNSSEAFLAFNGNLTDGSFAAVTTLGTGLSSRLTFSTDQVGQAYDIAFNTAPQSAFAIRTGSQFVNIDPLAGLGFFSNGSVLTTPGVSLGAAGFSFSLTVPVVSTSTLTLQGYVITPANPDGIALTQAATLNGFQDNQLLPSFLTVDPQATTITLTDDSSVSVALPTPFTFYGTSYSEVYVGSNGFLTFGAPSLDLSESESDLIGNEARIAFLWDDLNPSAGGTITHGTGAGGAFQVAFRGVAEFAQPVGNDVTIEFDASQVLIDYASIATPDFLVGMSPGGGLATPAPVNWSLGAGSTIIPGQAPFEIFDASNPVDVDGTQIMVILDPLGRPVTWL